MIRVSSRTALLAAGALLTAGSALAAWPFAPKPAPAPEPKPIVKNAEGHIVLEAPMWVPDRGRWCGLIQLAERPDFAGAPVRVHLEFRKGNTAAATSWRFYDASNQFTLSAFGASCYSGMKVTAESGDYTWNFTMPTDKVAIDPQLDAAMLADPVVQACLAQYPEAFDREQVLATVVDTDKRVWTHDGTRQAKNLRACVGDQMTASVKGQVEAGTFPLTLPAVLFVRLPANSAPAASAGGGKPVTKPAAPTAPAPTAPVPTAPAAPESAAPAPKP